MEQVQTFVVPGTTAGLREAEQGLDDFSAVHGLTRNDTWPFHVALDEILSYVLEQSSPQRSRYVADHLHAAFQKLAETPALGHKRDDLTSLPVLFWAVWSYLVIYKPDTEPLEVVRVLHGARDVEALLGEAE